jgi:hypothetical protein
MKESEVGDVRVAHGKRGITLRASCRKDEPRNAIIDDQIPGALWTVSSEV